MPNIEARNSGGVRSAEPRFPGIAGFVLIVAGTLLVALIVWESYIWYHQSVYPAKGGLRLRWTGAIFLVPIFGLTQPLLVLPAYFLTRRQRPQFARGLLNGGLATFILCLPLAWWLYQVMKGLAGLR
jgi:hypothetical protein